MKSDPIIHAKASKIVEAIEETINDIEKLSALRAWLNDRIDQDCKVVFKSVYGDKSYLTDDDITTLKKDFNKSEESKPE